MGFDRENEYQEWLDSVGTHRLLIIKRYREGLADFVLVYYVREAGVDIELASYDRAHGYGHRHLQFIPAGLKGYVKPLDGRTVQEQYDEAYEDVHKNWIHFFLKYNQVKSRVKSK